MTIFKNDIDFNLYKTFYAVAIFKSFSKAAKNLYISQPSISYSIKKCIEKELEDGIFYEIPLNMQLPKIDIGLAYKKKSK